MLSGLLAFFKPVIVFFTPPTFPGDEEKSRKAVYAHWISLAFTGAVFIFFVLRSTRATEKLGLLDAALFGIALVGILCWWLIRKGYVLFASVLIIVIVWTASNGIATDYGIRDASFILNFATITMAA